MLQLDARRLPPVPSSSGSEVVELSAEASGSGKSSAERLKVMRVTRRVWRLSPYTRAFAEVSSVACVLMSCGLHYERNAVINACLRYRRSWYTQLSCSLMGDGTSLAQGLRESGHP